MRKKRIERGKEGRSRTLVPEAQQNIYIRLRLPQSCLEVINNPFNTRTVSITSKHPELLK
jgi:hypothetical protein